MTAAICPDLVVVSDAAGRMRVQVPWVRANSRRAVAVEEAVDRQNGVRAVHAYPHTGAVVVWYSPKRCDRSAVLAAITSAEHVAAELIPARTPRSSDIRNTEVLRMVIGGAALALLGVRRYAFNGVHGLPVPSWRVALAAVRARRHRRPGDRRDRGQPGAARERGRAHRAVAAQYR
jgi:hypothetical protein